MFLTYEERLKLKTITFDETKNKDGVVIGGGILTCKFEREGDKEKVKKVSLRRSEEDYDFPVFTDDEENAFLLIGDKKKQDAEIDLHDLAEVKKDLDEIFDERDLVVIFLTEVNQEDLKLHYSDLINEERNFEVYFTKAVKHIADTDTTFADEIDFSNAAFLDDVGFSGVTFEKGAFFSNVIFKKIALFNGATFDKEANFSSASFRDKANFEKANFKENALFNEATFDKGALFNEAKFKEGALFNGANFKEKALFNRATFNKEANFFSASFSDEANFTEANFKGKAMFDKATFHKQANFSGISYLNNADFEKTNFKEKALFAGANFKQANFSSASFSDEANFEEATFEGEALLNGATFHKIANFNKAKFLDNVILGGSIYEKGPEITFKEKAEFSEATFDKKANFNNAKFNDGADFREATFKRESWFSKAIFYKEANFYEAIFLGEEEEEKNIDFKYTTFKEVAMFARAEFKNDAHFGVVNFYDRAVFAEAIFEKKLIFERAVFKNLFDLYGIVYNKENNKENKEKNFKLDLKGSDIATLSYYENLEYINEAEEKYNNGILNLETGHAENRETFNVLKNSAAEKKDNISALHFHTKEMEKYEKELNRSDKNGSDKLILWFEKTVSYYGTSIGRATTSLMFFNAFLIAVYCSGKFYSQPKFENINIIEIAIIFNILVFNYVVLCYTEIAEYVKIIISISISLLLLLYYALVYGIIKDVSVWGIIFPFKVSLECFTWIHAVSLVGNALLIYEVIKSFRKYSRRFF